MPIDTPRNRFRQNKIAAKEWQDVCYTQRFIDACDVAMLQLTDNLSKGDSGNGLRLEGAKLFRTILERLGEEDKPQTDKPTGLNYKL